MKWNRKSLLLASLLLTGCWQKSLHPFYTDSDVYTDPALGVQWQQKDGSQNRWAFAEGRNQRYDLVISDKDNEQKFEAHLFKLANERFMDVMSLEAGGSIPAHHLFKLVELGTNLQLAPLDLDWMQTWLRSHPEKLAHIRVPNPSHRDDRSKDELIVTADTLALQRFIRDHLSDPKMFGDIISLAPAGQEAPANANKSH